MRVQKVTERLAIWFGRRFHFRGSGRILAQTFPAEQGATRYLVGWYPRADGLIMHLDSRNSIDRNILFRGAYEPELGKIIEATLGPDCVALDIGANIGAHTLTMARVVGSSGQVLAFEPNPQVHKSLQENIRANGLEGVTKTFACALGEKVAEMRLRIPKPDSQEGNQLGLASLVALDTPHNLVTVDVRTADEVISKAGLSRVDLVKIDVQGFECQVLRGMCATLRSFTPMIVFEYERWAWKQGGGSLAQAIDILESAGYGIWHFTETGARMIEKSTEERTLPDHVDLVALPKEDGRISLLDLSRRTS